mgnify:CR=1 FL=1
MPGKIFIDTNIVIYALGQTSTKAHLAVPLFVGAPSISTQVLSETANVASKRLALSVSEIRKLITSLEVICRVEINRWSPSIPPLISGSGTASPGMTALLSPPRWKRDAIPFTPKICRTAKRLKDDCASSTRLFDPCLC